MLDRGKKLHRPSGRLFVYGIITTIMLEINTRYVLRNPENIEKVVVINNPADQAYYSKYVGQDGYSFTPIKITESKEACFACE